MTSHKLPFIGKGGQGVTSYRIDLVAYMAELARRLRRVRICAGDFRRVLTPKVTTYIGVTAILLDPPYSKDTGRAMNIYSQESGDVAAAAREWALANGNDPKLRIALCGYEGEHEMPDTWSVAEWLPIGGHGNRGGSNSNRFRERVWFSPNCLKPAAQTLFAAPSAT